MRIRHSVGLLLAGTGLALVVEPANAQSEASGAAVNAPDSGQAAERDAEIVVTGTQLRGVAPVGSSIISVGQQAIQDSGLATSSDILRSIPQVTGLGPGEATTGTNVNNATLNTSKAQGINLRGLGVQATLTLVDGRRQPAGGSGGQLFDASVIPAIALSRVDVVADGASATYGSDAVAGVVNLILRKTYDGFGIEARHGFADGYHDNQAAMIFGHSWSTGSFMIAGEYYQHSRLRQESRRNLFTCDFTPYGGRNACSTTAVPGNLTVNGTLYGLPAGSGRGVTQAQLSPTRNLQEQAAGNDSLPYLRRKSVVANLNQTLADNLKVYVEGYFSYRNFNSRAGGAAVGAATPVPATNPFFVQTVPAQTSEVVQYNLLNDLGTSIRGGYEQTYQVAGGLDYDIDSNFRLSLSAAHSGNDVDELQSNQPNTTLLAAALALTDPATAFNPFGSGGNNNQTTLNSFRGFTDRQAHFASDLFDAKVDGALFHIAGGDVRVAIGGEYRHDRFRNVDQGNNVTTSLSTIRINADTTRRRNVGSLFGELNVPLVGADNARPGLARLELNFAGRYDHYSDVGSTTNPKVGIRYDPIEGLSLHGSYGKSFRAPTLSDLNPSSTATVLTIPNFITFGNVLEYVGGNSDLKPETATTYSAGFDLRPNSIRNLQVSVNYYHILYTNVIDTPPIFSPVAFLDPAYAQYVIFNPTVAQVNATFSPSYAPPQTLPANSINAILDARRHNLGAVRTDGLDFNVQYALDTKVGTFVAGGNATYILRYDVAATAGAVYTKRVNQANFPLRFRGRANFGWHNDAVRFISFINYSNPYDNLTGTIAPSQRVASYLTVDSTLTFDVAKLIGVPLAKEAELSVGALNLFDRKPPFAAIATTQVFDSTVASPIGRTVTLSLRAHF